MKPSTPKTDRIVHEPNGAWAFLTADDKHMYCTWCNCAGWHDTIGPSESTDWIRHHPPRGNKALNQRLKVVMGEVLAGKLKPEVLGELPK